MTDPEPQAPGLSGEETAGVGVKVLPGCEDAVGPPGFTSAQLREANESLVIATVQAQTLSEAAEAAVAKMAFIAEHDDLTGLPTRSLLTDRLGQAIELAKRQGKTVALMYLDLDHFKSVNDALGHTAGDQLLQEVSRRLKACVRHSDTVSRQGGDEFLVLLPFVEAVEDAVLIARKLIEAMAIPIFLDGHHTLVTVSVGLSLFPHDGADAEAIIRNADTAMYQAKEQGRNNCQVYTTDMARRPEGQAEAAGPPAIEPAQAEVPSEQATPGQRPETLTLPEREAAVLAIKRTTDLREEAAEVREDAVAQLGRTLRSQEKAIEVREDSADRRENAATSREQSLRPKEEAARVQAELSASTQAQLQVANERLVIATVQAQTMQEAAEKATEQISKLAKLETHLQEVQKLETLGILAGGVAHDFNNLLTSIMGNASLASLKVHTEGDPSPHFEAIEKAAMRAADLTRQLLDYAGKTRTQMTQVDIGTMIQEIIQLLQVSLPERVAMQLYAAERLPFVKADATQIFQVLMNLVSNASEASQCGTGGSITIWTREENLDEAALLHDSWVLPVPPGSYVTLEVKDTGIGMTPEIRARIFEPFFTTKFTGRGLGLAAVMGIIRGHGGGITLESEPGKGSTFKIFLPALPAA